MRTIRTDPWIVVLGCLLLIWGGTPEALGQVPLNTNAASDAGDDQTPDIAIAGGTWVAVWSADDGLNDDDVFVSRSTNQGATWTTPLLISTTANGLQEYAPEVAGDGSGNWIAIWTIAGFGSDIVVSRSTDDGLTWSPPAVLQHTASNDESPDIATNGTTWVTTWHGGGSDRELFFARSIDAGATWSDPAILNTNAAIDGAFHDENPAVAHGSSGVWIVSWSRTDPNGLLEGDAYVARSTDDGVSWGDPQSLNSNTIPGFGPGKRLDIATDRLGNWAISWTTLDLTEFDPDIAYVTSTDDGLTWSPPALVDAGAVGDGGIDRFSQIETDGQGCWVLAWHSTRDLGGTIGSDFDLLYSASFSNGANWTSPAAPATNATFDGSSDFKPHLATYAGDRWVFVWQSDDTLGGTVDTDFDIFMLRELSNPCGCAQPCRLGVAKVILSDDIDDDGFADTNENVEMRLELYNRCGVALSGLTVSISTTDPKIGSITNAGIAVAGVLNPGATVVTDPFTFQVANVDRASLRQDFSVQFDLGGSSTQVPLVEIQPVVIDLDLDVSGGALPTSYFEGFETGLGSLEIENIDGNGGAGGTDLHDLTRADGYRCSYNDPDLATSNTFGTPEANECFPGVSADHAQATWWQVDDWIDDTNYGRAYSGVRSLYFGQSRGTGLGRTTPLGVIEAVRSIDAINLNWGGRCSISTDVVCAADTGCPAGETCVDRSYPRLSITHQASLADRRLVDGIDGCEAADRAVVMVRMTDNAGTPFGPWIRLEPFSNGYDKQADDGSALCSFDVIDDGNDEDSGGPSSTCGPEWVFAHIGDTGQSFDADATGSAEGSGLPGSAGDGTWVRSDFDLSRFRGRSVRLRFLVSTRKGFWILGSSLVLISETVNSFDRSAWKH